LAVPVHQIISASNLIRASNHKKVQTEGRNE